MVTHQTIGYVTQQIPCSKCGKIQSRKGKHQIVLRTLFGKLRLDSPRLYHCGCCSTEVYRSFSPLARVTDGANGTRVGLPGEQVCGHDFLRLTAELLAEVLRTGGDINVAGVYRNLQGLAERMEAELGEEKWQFIDGCSESGYCCLRAPWCVNVPAELSEPVNDSGSSLRNRKEAKAECETLKARRENLVIP